jgi:hypothetical protein
MLQLKYDAVLLSSPPSLDDVSRLCLLRSPKNVLGRVLLDADAMQRTLEVHPSIQWEHDKKRRSFKR